MMKEIRSNEIISAKEESRKVEGYGVVFNSESVDLGGFTEIILPNAIDEETVRNSDILFLLDHNRERGVLARSKNGAGSLKVNVDDKGVRYEFDAPQTALGDEILEGLRRGDVNKCSFAFTVAEDSWVKREDGTVLRTINKIDRLYDLSIVVFPAYDDTSVNIVDKRGLDEILKSETIEVVEETKDIVEERNDEEDEPKEGEETQEENPDENSDDVKEEDRDNSEDEDKSDDVKDTEEETESEEEKEDRSETNAESNTEQRNLYNKTNSFSINTMSNKFSLIGTINDLIANRSNEYIKNGKIEIPFETRGAEENPVAANGIMQSEATMGHETIKQSMWPLLTDLKNRLILNELGAQFITADSEISIPKYSSGTCAWLGEVDHAVDAAGKFESEKVTPKRLSAYIDISNTWLRMTGVNAEEILRQELVNCIAQKIEETVFSNVAGNANRPEGLLYNVTADVNQFKFDDAISMEQALEEANANSGNIKYAASPAAKHYLRTLPIDKGSGRMVLENNECLGIPVLSSNNLVSKSLILGDWRELFVVMFSNMTIVTDTLTRAAYDQTRVIVNLSVSPYVRRPECFVKRILA